MERDSTNPQPPPPPPSSSFSLPIKTEFPSPAFVSAEEDEAETPRPLECLNEAPTPPFLSKTYDIVNDSSVDAVVSWGPAGNSFVVWDPHLFERAVLPRHFKHSNFSSFARQLNTYGFRKISADRWEFANECFLRGNKLLLKNINRRRSQGGAQTSSPFAIVKPSLESELQNLQRDKITLIQEVSKLQQDHLMTIQHMNSLNEKLQSAEERQTQMVSFLDRIIRNPSMFAQFRIHQEQRQRRKFLKHQQQGQSSSALQPQIPDAISHDVTVRSEQFIKSIREPPCLESVFLPEDAFPEVGLPEVDLHGCSCSDRPSVRGKGIMEEHQHGAPEQGLHVKPFPDIDLMDDPNLLELPDAFYDLDLELDLDLGPAHKNVDYQVPGGPELNTRDFWDNRELWCIN